MLCAATSGQHGGNRPVGGRWGAQRLGARVLDVNSGDRGGFAPQGLPALGQPPAGDGAGMRRGGTGEGYLQRVPRRGRLPCGGERRLPRAGRRQPDLVRRQGRRLQNPALLAMVSDRRCRALEARRPATRLGGRAEAGGSISKLGCGLGQARRPADRRVLTRGIDGADGLPERGQVRDIGLPLLVEVPVDLATDGEQLLGGGAGFSAAAKEVFPARRADPGADLQASGGTRRRPERS